MMNGWQRLVAVVGLVVAVGLAVYPTWEVKAESLDSELLRASLALQGRVEIIDGQVQYVAPQVPLAEYEILTRRAFVFAGPYVARKTLYVKILWSLFALEQGLVWVPTIAIILILRRVTIGKEFDPQREEGRAPWR